MRSQSCSLLEEPHSSSMVTSLSLAPARVSTPELAKNIQEQSSIDSLNSHDASKHHFASPKKFPTHRRFRTISWNCFINDSIFFSFAPPPTSIHLHPLHVENCDNNSRLVVDENDNCKFRVKAVKELITVYRRFRGRVSRVHQNKKS